MATHWSSFLTLHIPYKNLALSSISGQSEPVGIIKNVMWSCLYSFDMLKLVQPSPWLFPITMKPISAEKCSSVISLLKDGYPHFQIIAKTSALMGTVNKISREVDLVKKNNPGDHPSNPLLRTNSQLFTKSPLESSTMLSKPPNSPTMSSPILSHPKQSEIHWRRVDYTLQQRRNYQCLRRLIVIGNFSSVCITKTGLWRTWRGCYGHMRQRLIKLGNMGRFMSGKNVENPYLTALQHQLSNMEAVITWWYGAVWVGME